MTDELTPAQLRTIRRALAFAILLAVMDVCIIGTLLYIGFLELPY